MYKLFLCLRYLRKRRIAFFAVGAVCLCVAMVLIVVSVMGGFLQMVKDRSRGMLGDLVVENETLQGFPFYEDFIDEIKTDPELGPRIHEATPVIISYGVLRFPRTMITKPVQIVGINLEETYRVNDFKKGLFYEKYYPGSTALAPQKDPCFGLGESNNEILPPDLEAGYQKWWSEASEEERAAAPIDERLSLPRPGLYRPIPQERLAVSREPAWLGQDMDGIIIGTDICAKRTSTGRYERYYSRGEPVQLTMVPLSETGKLSGGSGMPSELFRYADDSRTGVYDIDSLSVYVDFKKLQYILDMEERETTMETPEGERKITMQGRTTQVQIKLTAGTDPLATKELLDRKWAQIRDRRIHEVRAPELLYQVTIRTWEEKQARFIAAVEKEKYLVTTLFGVISLVAVFLVGCIFYMIVQQKTRDIGIIKSVGATSFGVSNIFLGYGAAVGIVGGALGVGLGWLFVRNINEIQALLARIDPQLNVWNAEVYAFDRIPDQVQLQDMVVIYTIAIVASMIGSLIAAVRAAMVWPVEALRYE